MTERLIFFDLETAGTDPKRHPIIQVAAAAVDHRGEVLEAFEAKLQFDARNAKSHSLRKNHYHPGVWAKEALDPRIVAKDFASFLSAVLALSPSVPIYLHAEPIDMRESFDGLYGIIKNDLARDVRVYEHQDNDLQVAMLPLALMNQLYDIDRRGDVLGECDHALASRDGTARGVASGRLEGEPPGGGSDVP